MWGMRTMAKKSDYYEGRKEWLSNAALTEAAYRTRKEITPLIMHADEYENVEKKRWRFC
jgi:hypothetical protein